MIKESFYTSHDFNARNDEKILELRVKYGWEGYGLYWAVIEIMGEAKDNKISLDLINGISMSLCYDSEKFIEFINFCCKKPLLLFQKKNGYIVSQSLLNRMALRKQLKELRASSGSKEGKVRALRIKKAKEKGDHTKEEWEEMKKFFNNECVKCGGKNIEKDHIIPIYQEGSNSIINIQPLCKTCNNSKGPDNIDWRLNKCESLNKQIPSKWVAKPKQNVARKGKERKEKENKGNRNENKGNENKENIVFPIYVNSESLDAFFEMRKKKDKGKSMTPGAIKILLNKIVDFHDRGFNVNELLDNSTVGNWASIYEPKPDNINYSHGKKKEKEFETSGMAVMKQIVEKNIEKGEYTKDEFLYGKDKK